MTITDEELRRLVGLSEKATPGPVVAEEKAWGKGIEGGCGVIASNDELRITNPSRGIVAWASRRVGMTNAECEANAKLLAAGYNLAPQLAAELLAVREALAEIANHAEKATRNGDAAMAATLDDIVSHARAALPAEAKGGEL
jgi:hypothetical protein